VETGGKLIAKHLKRMKTEVLRTLKKSTYRNIFKIKNKDFMVENFNDYDNDYQMDASSDYEVFAWDYEKYTDRILPTNYEWITIGDVHGCYSEMIQLLEKYGFEIKDGNITDTEKTTKFGLIFAGDLVDKSSNEDIAKTIIFIHNNMGVLGDRLQLIMGNHEEMVWKWITKHKDLEITPKRIEEKARYYNTAILLEDDEILKEKFLEIFAKMKGWVKMIGTDKRSFIVTHAPCEIKFLEKMDGKSLKKQYKCLSRSKNKELTNDQLTPYLKEEAVKNQPIHIFAHMGQSSVRTFKNKVCIDAGCVYGGKLVGYTVGFGKPFIQTVNKDGETGAQTHFGNNLFEEVAAERKTVDINSLSDFNQRRLNYIMDNGIGYIGGTISPAPKDEETGDFESLKAGLDYYKGKVKSVVLQPKYMGSRAQVYLNRDIEKCYATSRNGYKIKTDLTEVFEQQLEQHKGLMDDFDIQEMVMDGELMPWASLGRGLIESQFVVIDKAVESEIDFLRENGFDEAFMELQQAYTESGFIEDRNKMNKKELAKVYGHAYNNFKNIQWELDRFQPNKVHQDAWDIYHKQVGIYGADGETHYKPFRILKTTKTDERGGGVFNLDMDTALQFSSINNDSMCEINFEDENYLEVAQKWYDGITTVDEMEGCVIKPNDQENPDWLAPFMKVRNPNYLHIIYGYDMNFPKKFTKLFNQKNIGRKLRASIAEYKLGEEMLGMEVGSVELRQAVANMMFENEKELGIDPRL
ncbi:MAG: metallophosphoesterase, partial [Bacteroidota bacterium]|nr:metallophosphoesterase [Bacteroidota bacterium]